MATKDQLAAATLYCNIMAEVKLRTEAIDAGTSGRLPLAPTFVREFCYLQLRMICELVALGCLVAHGDIKATKSKALMKEWSAEAIAKTLSDLHPDFFPKAARQKWMPPGTTHHPVDTVNPPPMTKAEFLSLYGRCGAVLHKGNLKKLMKEQMPLQISYPEITAKAQKFADLLGYHIVPMLGERMFFVCAFNVPPDNSVQVLIAESTQPLQSSNEAASPSGKKR